MTTKTKITAAPGPTTVTSIRVWVREFLDGVPQDPIPDAKVTLTEFATGKVAATGLTDGNGNFKATFLKVGDYYVSVSKPLYGPVPTVGNKPAAGVWTSPKTYCGSIASLPKDPKKPSDALPVLFDARMVTELETPNFMMEFGDRLDYDFGELLKDLSRFPDGSHAHQVAHFTHSEMKGGNLIAVVSAGKSLTVLKDKLPVDEYETLKTTYLKSGDITANAYYFGLQNDPRRRGYALISNSNSSVARESGFSTARTRLAAVFGHEINHFRNRVLIDGIGGGINATNFVDPALAGSTDGEGTRYRFINELAARHEGWHVAKDISGAKGPHVPAVGAFWNKIVDYSAWYTAFEDLGYMQGLSAVDRQKQACIWLTTCANVMIYHYDDPVNKAIQAMMKSEANLGVTNNYLTIAGVAPDGLA
ncbi:MAG: carboxypeptidase regulatory-like domain-containing protein [Fibrobacteres bacterium]|nr:carboxypeptidase regulatory-like domain-containing protein [Fibrobacterota bacterium]